MRYTAGYYSKFPRKDWGGALTGASTGYQMGSSIGSMFGPVAGKIAGGAGLIIGALTGNKAENKKIKAQKEQDALIAQAKEEERVRALQMQKKQTRANDTNYLAGLDLSNQNSLFMKKGGWIQKATASIKRRGTEGVCTGSKFGSSSCPPGSKRYNLAKTFRKMAKHRPEGGQLENPTRLTKQSTKMIVKNNIVRPRAILEVNADMIASGYIKDTTTPITTEMRRAYMDANSNRYKYIPRPVNKKGEPLKIGTANEEGKIWEIVPMEVSNSNQKFKANKEYYKLTGMKQFGGKIAGKGINLGQGDKILTNKSGGFTGTHESGQNIPLKKNGKTLAIGEPGEVLVNDKNMPLTPFVLSKRLGFAQRYLALEKLKNKNNKNSIEDQQANLIIMNNKVAGKGKRVPDGINLYNELHPKKKPLTIGTPLYSTSKLGQVQYSTSKLGEVMTNPYASSAKQVHALAKKGKTKFDFSKLKEKELDMNTIMGAAGTVGNLLMSNRATKRQGNLIQNSLNDALAYTPTLNKNYLLNENVDVNDQVSSINQGYTSSISGLQGVDPAIASALKNSANRNRVNQLGSVYANRNNIRTGLRNQNTIGIMQNNAANNDTLNQTSLMKLNAKISANEQMGDLESAKLGNVQGAISEFNTILRDKDMMNSLKARWKDSIGTDAFGLKEEYKRGGKIVRRKRRYSFAR